MAFGHHNVLRKHEEHLIAMSLEFMRDHIVVQLRGGRPHTSIPVAFRERNRLACERAVMNSKSERGAARAKLLRECTPSRSR